MERRLCEASPSGDVDNLHKLIQEDQIILNKVAVPCLDSIRERLHRGDTVLPCVKYYRLKALKLLVESVHDDELINSKDDDGNTILHVGATLKQMEIIKCLLLRMDVKIKANALNENSFTALDVLEQCLRDLKGMELRDKLLEAGVPRTLRPSAKNVSATENHTTQTQSKTRQFLSKVWKMYFEIDGKWLEETRGSLIVVVTLIATMAFQAGIKPPGGIWQKTNDNHNAGTSVVASKFSAKYHKFLVCDTVSLVTSLSIIVILISGFPLNNKLSMFILMVAMSVLVIFVAFTHLIAIGMIMDTEWSVEETYAGGTYAWFLGLAFAILLYRTRLLTGPVDKLLKFYLKRWPGNPANKESGQRKS